MKNYVQTTLDGFINESRSVILKRGYGDRKPVIVGTNAPTRNRILSFVKESVKVSQLDLKKFIAGLNETNANPSAAASMWLKRNAQYFITESKNGRTYFKLSSIGERLIKNMTPATNTPVSESRVNKFGKKLNEFHHYDDITDLVYKLADKGYSKDETEEYVFNYLNAEHADQDNYHEAEEVIDNVFAGVYESKKSTKEFMDPQKSNKSYDFKDPKTGKKGIVDADKEEDEVEEVKEGLSFSRRKRIESIIENIRAKENQKRLYEADEEEKEESDDEGSDELSLDDVESDSVDLDTDDESSEEEKSDDESSEESSDDLGDDEEKVEITEFIITVDDVDSAIKELEEKGVDASKVADPDAEKTENEDGEEETVYKEDQISVPAEQWTDLKDWLEEKGVDVEEMFGGEISVEDEESEEGDLDSDEESADGEDISFDDLDLDSEEGDDLGSDDLEIEENSLGLNEDDEDPADENSEEGDEFGSKEDDEFGSEEIEGGGDNDSDNFGSVEGDDIEGFDHAESIEGDDIDDFMGNQDNFDEPEEEQEKSELLVGAKEVTIKY